MLKLVGLLEVEEVFMLYDVAVFYPSP